MRIMKVGMIMTKVGKALNNVTSATTRASGVITKNVGEAISDVANAVGVNEDISNKIEHASDKLGKDLYYAGHTVGNKVENATEDVMEATKKTMKSIKNHLDL